MLHVHEAGASKGVDGIEWLLITTLPITINQQAQDVIDLYGRYWRIEGHLRILKSGCDVEKIAHTTAERIKRAVTINAVIACRLATVISIWRKTPELLAEAMYSKVEIAVLADFALDRGFPHRAAGASAMSLGGAIMLITLLGGYLNRKNDAPPGHQVVWEGYTRFAVATREMER